MMIEILFPFVISIVALGTTMIFGYTSFKQTNISIRLSRERDLDEWVKNVLNTFVDLQSPQHSDRSKLLARLSALIDLGRLFFPNDPAENETTGSVGYRSAILDPLVKTHRDLSANSDWSHFAFQQHWRQFIEELKAHKTTFALRTSPEALGQRQYRNT